MKKDHKNEVWRRLEDAYHDTGTALEFADPFQLLVAVMLSAQTTDNQVNKITRGLFVKYPTPEKMAALGEEELRQEIKGCGLYRTKARNILSTVKVLLDKYGGKVPPDRDALLKLPGVGRKTANVVLAVGFKQPALGVDTHVFRVSRRLGLATGKNPAQVEEELMSSLPPEKWGQAHHWLIWHGRQVCRARNPLCGECSLWDICPESVRSREKQTEGETP